MNVNFGKNHIQRLNIHESRRDEKRYGKVSGRVTGTQRGLLERVAEELGISMSEALNQAVTFYLEFYPYNIDMTRLRKTIFAMIESIPAERDSYED